jgi:hypothetical protein
MVDDDLFPGVEGEPAASREGEPATSPQGALTKNDVLSIIKDFVEPSNAQMSRITNTQSQLAEALSTLQENLSQFGLSGQRGNGAPNGSGDDDGDSAMDASDFLTNPQAHIRRIAEEIADVRVREQVGPLLSQIVSQSHKDAVDSHRAVIDREFGEGAWDKEFYTELKPIFDRTKREAPSQLGNREAISRAVDAIKGAKFDRLSEMRTAARSTQAKNAERERTEVLEFVNSNLSGGITRSTPKSVLSEDMKAYIEAEFRGTGSRPDEREFLASLNSGTTLQDWQAAQKSLKK